MVKNVSFPQLDQEVDRYIESNQDTAHSPEIIKTDYTEFGVVITKYVYVVNGSVMVRFYQDYFIQEERFGEAVFQSWFTFQEARMFISHLAGVSWITA